MTLANLRFQSLWQRIFGGPMFPAKPLKDGGVIQRRPEPAPTQPVMVVVTTPSGSQRLAWRIPGDTPLQIVNKLIEHTDLYAHQGSRRAGGR